MKMQGFLFGIIFGFLLQKGHVTYYDTILGQLLLKDFTVMKIMLTAIVVGMWGVTLLKNKGYTVLHIKPYSFGSTVIGGLIFGIGMAVLGYCPGTLSGAAAQGNLDALVGGITGVFFGSWFFSLAFPFLDKALLHKGELGEKRLPELLRMNEWVLISLITVVSLSLFLLLEKANL